MNEPTIGEIRRRVEALESTLERHAQRHADIETRMAVQESGLAIARWVIPVLISIVGITVAIISVGVSNG